MTKHTPVSFLEEASALHHTSSSNKPSESLDIRIITHNIRYATESPSKGEEQWEIRCPRLCSQLKFNSLQPNTFICLQEVLHAQLKDILRSLNDSESSGIQWDYIGVGRDDGKEAGEYSPILYRPSVWRLNFSETRWLSPTPEVPSKGWDAASIRLVTIGSFTHVHTSKKVFAFNTHLDNEGANSRIESAKMILNTIYSLSDLEDPSPSAILLAGDFNSSPDDGAYRIITSAGSNMEDVGIEIPQEQRYGNDLTYTSFGYVDNTPNRIDFIFSRKGNDLIYRTYAVLANSFDDGVYLSDHRACVADMSLH